MTIATFRTAGESMGEQSGASLTGKSDPQGNPAHPYKQRGLKCILKQRSQIVSFCADHIYGIEESLHPFFTAAIEEDLIEIGRVFEQFRHSWRSEQGDMGSRK